MWVVDCIIFLRIFQVPKKMVTKMNLEHQSGRAHWVFTKPTSSFSWAYRLVPFLSDHVTDIQYWIASSMSNLPHLPAKPTVTSFEICPIRFPPDWLKKGSSPKPPWNPQAGRRQIPVDHYLEKRCPLIANTQFGLCISKKYVSVGFGPLCISEFVIVA